MACGDSGRRDFKGDWRTFSLIQKKFKKPPKDFIDDEGSCLFPCLSKKPVYTEIPVHVMWNPEKEAYYGGRNSIVLGPHDDYATYEFDARRFDRLTSKNYFVNLVGKTMKDMNTPQQARFVSGIFKGLQNSPFGVLMRTEHVPDSVALDVMHRFNQDFGKDNVGFHVDTTDPETIRLFKFSIMCSTFVEKMNEVLRQELGAGRPVISLACYGFESAPALIMLKSMGISNSMDKYFVIKDTAIGRYCSLSPIEIKAKVRDLGKQTEHTLERLAAEICDQVVCTAPDANIDAMRAQLDVYRVYHEIAKK